VLHIFTTSSSIRQSIVTTANSSWTTSPLKRWLALITLGLAGLLVGCSERSPEWNLYDVKGHLPDLSFELQAAGDTTFTEKDLEGKTVLMFFGYASCPDICPTTMAQLSQIVTNLGDNGQDVRIVFVSVDPHRDTPDVLQEYVNAFNPNAIGLTGNVPTIARLAKKYRIAYQIEKPKPGDDADIYNVTHSQGIYIFDNRGQARLLASDSEDTAAFTADVQKLINETS
jgi:protein SCO1/2